MFDAMTRPLQNITNSMNLMIRAMEQMQSSANRNLTVDRTLTAAKKQLASAETEIKKNIDAAKQAQDRFTQSVRNTKQSADSLSSSIKNWATGLAAAYLTVQGIQSALGSADTFISARARLDLIVDEGQSVDDLQAQIHAAAQRARGDFIAMTDNIARLGILASDAFSSSGEIVAFVETLQKAFTISGAGTQEQAAAMYQLSQAMASGRLQGDEFRSIMENAPMLADAIARYLGVSKGELRDLSSEGALTADVIKAALFSAADDINAKFAEMPMTFGAMFQKVKNETFRAFAPVFQQMSDWLNSERGAAVMNNITNAIYLAAAAASGLLNVLTWIGDVIANNWSIIEPILMMVAGILLAMMIQQLWRMVVAAWAMVPPLLAQAAAWLAMNWPILLIGAAIGLLIYVFNQWGDIAAKVIGFIGGIIGTLVAFVYNQFVWIANGVLSVAEFFMNVWRDPVYAVKKLFYDLVITALKQLEKLASGIENIINKIPGLQVDITSGIGNLLDKLESARDSLQSEADVVELMRFEPMDYAEAFNIGREWGEAAGNFVADKVQGAFDKIQNMAKGFGGGGNAIEDINKYLANIDKNGLANVDKVGKIEDTVDISNEDLKLMRELAEMKSIQNFVTLTPTVQVTTGDIRNDVDVDTIVRRIEESLEREIVNSAQGVFA
jgi:tape measure domain-containing protein